MKTLAEMTTDELVHFGKLRLIEGDFNGAADAFTLALEGGGDRTVALSGRGVANLRLGKYGEAVDDFSGVLSTLPDESRFFHYRGTARHLKGDNETALEDLSKALELDPKNGTALFMRGIVFEALGRDDEAARDIGEALNRSELEIQRFAESIGIVRTKTDKWWAEQIGERRAREVPLAEKQTEKLQEWMDEEVRTCPTCSA